MTDCYQKIGNFKGKVWQFLGGGNNDLSKENMTSFQMIKQEKNDEIIYRNLIKMIHVLESRNKILIIETIIRFGLLVFHEKVL